MLNGKKPRNFQENTLPYIYLRNLNTPPPDLPLQHASQWEIHPKTRVSPEETGSWQPGSRPHRGTF